MLPAYRHLSIPCLHQSYMIHQLWLLPTIIRPQRERPPRATKNKHTAINEPLPVSFHVRSLSDGLLEIPDGLIQSDGDSELELAWPLDVDRDLFGHDLRLFSMARCSAKIRTVLAVKSSCVMPNSQEWNVNNLFTVAVRKLRI